MAHRRVKTRPDWDTRSRVGPHLLRAQQLAHVSYSPASANLIGSGHDCVTHSANSFVIGEAPASRGKLSSSRRVCRVAALGVRGGRAAIDATEPFAAAGIYSLADDLSHQGYPTGSEAALIGCGL